MNGVEAAASLFGSEDLATDPFSNLGENTSTHSTGDDLFGTQTTVSSALGDNAEEQNFFSGETETKGFHDDGAPVTNYSYSDTYGGQAPATEGGSWDAGPAQSSGDPYAYTPATTHNYLPPANNSTNSAPTSFYGGQTTSVQAKAYPQSHYDAYAPIASHYATAPPVLNSYAPAETYTPPSASYNGTFDSTPHSGFAAQTDTTLPPPPVNVPTVTRPKVSNAYDPPFLPSKPARRTASRPGLNQPSTPYGSYQLPAQISPQQSYGSPQHAQNYYASPPPPVEPPVASTGNSWNPAPGDYSANPTTHKPVAHTSVSDTVHEPLPPSTNVASNHMSWHPVPQNRGTVNSKLYEENHHSPPLDPYGVHANASHQDGAHYSVPGPETTSYPTSEPQNGGQHSYTLANAREYMSSPAPYHQPPLPQAGGADNITNSPEARFSHLKNEPPSGVPPLDYSVEGVLADSPGMSPYASHQVSNAHPPPRALQATRSSTSVVRSQSPKPPTPGPNQLPRSMSMEERTSSPVTAPLPDLPDSHSSKTSRTMNGNEAAYRAMSPTMPPPRANGIKSAKNYVPANYIPSMSEQSRLRSMSGSSITSSSSDPYAPMQHFRQQSIDTTGGLPAMYPQFGDNYPPAIHQPLQEAQELQVKSAPAPYAPSPSLLGLNDPLGRTAARIPVFSFGFGGKVATCFHGVANLQTGFDVALSSRNSTGINIHILNKIVPQSALDASMAEYPGPLFMDPGTPTTNLVRTGVSTQLKAKKGRVQKYLTDRMDEISQGLGYLNKNSPDKYRAESRLVLLRLLHAMVEHDGRVSGTPQIDKAMRSALVPGPSDETVESSISTSAAGFSAPADVQSLAAGLPLTQFSSPLTDPQDHVISTTTLHSSSLDKIQDFLIRGERRLAYHYALDNQLWSHAMVIASSIDKDAWKEVVGEFLKSELGVKSHTLPTNYHHATTLPPTNGREGLRVAYSLYSGQGSAAVQELVPQNLLARATNRPQLPVVSHASSTPLTPNFGAPLPVPIPAESLSKWAETAAMMLSSPMTAETSSAFTALGDQLVASKCFEAAHVCYLLAPQTSPIGGPGNPTARIMLLGSQNPHLGAGLGKDPDPIIFSEILEFALSLTPTAKGQDGFGGLAHLQSYRFVRAMSYAELGDLQLASSYCEAITASLGRGSPYFTNTLVEQLKGLSDRIAGVSHNDKSGSWMGAKLSKPSLDTIGGWLEGRFTKLVTGETDTAALPQEETNHVTDQSFSGPFTHYSTISSTTPSASPSPQPSVINLNTLPPRSGSALATSSPYVPHTQIDRASSAMDYTRRKPSPGPRVASASAATTTFSHTPSFGQALNAFSSNGRYSPSQETPKPRSHDANGSEGAAPGQEVSWWGASSYGETDDQTPRTATFLPIEEGSVSATSDGFISLMDTPSVSTTPQSSIRNFQTSTIPEDEEDLGFGNSRLTPNREHNNQSNESSPVNVEPTPTKANSEPSNPPKQPPASTGSWISRWWKRPESATPGPIKASLGEEKAFYYDEKLKKWVNPKDTAGPPTPSVPPPPPSRAQTASPAMTGHRPPSAAGSAAPPPARASSAIDLTSSPPNKSTMRVRSNLVPPPESAPSTPTGSRLAPQGPPPGRPKSQASKRNIRNRYVDVFQEGGGP